MRVLVDAREAYRNITGLGRVIKNFCLNMDKIDGKPEYLFLPEYYLEKRKEEKKTVLRRAKNLFDFFWWRQAVIPLQAKKWQADVIFCMDYVPPFFTKLPTVIIVYDLLFYEALEYDPFWGIYYRQLVPPAVKKASRILTISEASKRAIIERFDEPEEKVVVAYPGVADVFYRMSEDEALSNLRQKYPDLPAKFVLFVGSIDNSRRNFNTLLTAFAALPPEIAPKLVVVGLFGYGHEAVLQRATELNLQDRVIFTGFVPDDELRWFYNLADLFVYPSLGEGFGMIVLEAMACGCPIICSDRMSLPEVAGDAGILLTNPTDTEELAAHMTRILTTPQLRADMSRRSQERSRIFSWEQSARIIQMVLEESAKGIDYNDSNVKNIPSLALDYK